MLNQNFTRALDYLKNHNFSSYITALATLGVEISSELNVSSVKELSKKIGDHELINQLNIDINNFSSQEIYQLRYAAALFAHHWHNDKQSKTELAKYNLNHSSRRAIHLGLFAIEEYLNQKNNIEPPALLNSIENSDQLIPTAIFNYETKKQKILRYIGKSLALISSITFGALETGVAIFFVGMLLFTPASLLALTALLTGSLALGSVFSYVSYCTLKDDTPALLKEILGKDKFFEGFLEYKSPSGHVAFSHKQKAALAAFSLCFALPTAVSAGAFAFTSSISIPALLSLFGITVAASAFPPIGIALAAIITLTMTLATIRSFHSFIAYHNGNLLSFIRQPFNEVNAILDKKIDPIEHPTKNKIAKIASHTTTAIVCLMGLAGLGIASMGGANSVNALVARLFKTSLTVSSIVGIVVGGILSFASRSLTTVAKCGGAVVNLFKLGFHDEVGKINRFGLLTGILLDLPLSAFFWIDAFLRPAASSPILPMPSTMKAAALATACTTVRDAGLVIDSMFTKTKNKPAGADETYQEEIKAQVLADRKFVKRPSNLQHFTLFKTFTETTHSEHQEILYSPSSRKKI